MSVCNSRVGLVVDFFNVQMIQFSSLSVISVFSHDMSLIPQFSVISFLEHSSEMSRVTVCGGVKTKIIFKLEWFLVT